MADKEARKRFFKNIENSLRKADGVVTISQFTKDKLIDRFALEENKIKTVYHGIDKNYLEKIPLDVLNKTKEKYDLPDTFLLFVGAVEPRKNLPGLLKALKVIHREHDKIPLILVGRKGEDHKNVITTIETLKLKNWVTWIGYTSDIELRSLYRLASVFVFPSFHEGFGLPLIEAMASQVPIAASQNSAIPEIAKNAALFFHPGEPDDIAEKVLLILKDNNLQKKLINRGKRRVKEFDWDITAKETLSFYRSIAGK